MTRIEKLSADILTSMQALSNYEQAGDLEGISKEAETLVRYLRQALPFEDADLEELITYAIGLLPPERAKGLLEKEMNSSPSARVAAMRVAAYALEPTVAFQILQDLQRAIDLNTEATEAIEFLLKKVLEDRAKEVESNS